jgi:hypothetical protein
VVLSLFLPCPYHDSSSFSYPVLLTDLRRDSAVLNFTLIDSFSFENILLHSFPCKNSISFLKTINDLQKGYEENSNLHTDTTNIIQIKITTKRK